MQTYTDQGPTQTCTDQGYTQTCTDQGPTQTCTDQGPTQTCTDQGRTTRCGNSAWASSYMTCLTSTIHQLNRLDIKIQHKMATGMEENLVPRVFCQK